MTTNIGHRLAEERRRLGKTQVDFAELAGVGRASQENYEAGRRSPDATYLKKIAKVGADIQYILTGVRSTNLKDVAEDSATYKVNKGIGALSREEEKVVEMFRAIRPEDRTAIKKVVTSLASASEEKGKTGS